MLAVYKKELRSYLTSMIGYVFIAFILLILGFILLLTISSMQARIRRYFKRSDLSFSDHYSHTYYADTFRRKEK